MEIYKARYSAINNPLQINRFHLQKAIQRKPEGRVQSAWDLLLNQDWLGDPPSASPAAVRGELRFPEVRHSPPPNSKNILLTLNLNVAISSFQITPFRRSKMCHFCSAHVAISSVQKSSCRRSKGHHCVNPNDAISSV